VLLFSCDIEEQNINIRKNLSALNIGKGSIREDKSTIITKNTASDRGDTVSNFN